jgi:hypothetical protein
VSVTTAQEPIWDTIHFEGDYLVKCACVKEKKAVVDLRSLTDTGMIDRFVFHYMQNDKNTKLKKSDTIQFSYAEPFVANYPYHPQNRYLTINRDSVRLIVYRPSYKMGKMTRNGRLFFVEEPVFTNYRITKKCPNKVISKANFVYRFKNWFHRVF